MFKLILGLSISIVYSSPIWSTALITSLGNALGKEVLGESGIIIQNGIKITHQSLFDNILAGAGTFPWLLLPIYAFPEYPAKSLYALITFTPYYLAITGAGIVSPILALGDFLVD